MKLFKLILPVLFIFFSCSNDSDNTNRNGNASLELTVMDEFTYPFGNVEINLYASQNDLDNNTNIVATSTTDNNAKVVFENLQPIKYYWKINLDCYTNNDIHGSEQPLTDNTLNQFTIHLTNTGVGNIVVTNNDIEGFNVTYIGRDNGSFSVNTGDSIPLDNLLSGHYVFTLTGVDTGNVITHEVIVNCGETTQVTFEGH